MNPTIPGGLRSARIDAVGELSIRHGVALPPAAPGHVLVRTLVSALCGSDLHRFRGAESYGLDTDVFGHETVAAIVNEASGTLTVTAHRVLALPFPAAGRVFADYQSVPTATLIPVPDGLEPERAVFGQQLGTVIYALRRYLRASGVADSDTVPERVAVVGAGPAGLLFVKLLRLLGCPSVAVVERVEHRLALALRNGAVQPDGRYPLAIDTTGEADGRAVCLSLVADGGVIGIFGLPDDEPGDLGVDVLTILGRNLTISGAMGAQGEPGLRSFREAVAILADGRIDVTDLVSHVGDLDDLPALSRIAAHQTEDVSKVLIHFPFALEESS